MNKITEVTGPGVPLLLDDIDTDRIIPARFLRCVTFDGLGEHAFEDDREQDADHPFNHEKYRNGKVLVAGRNFGCGSSREHAPQSLIRWGIQAIIAETYAEIFLGNCTALGTPAVTAGRTHLEELESLIKANPETSIHVDLNSMTVTAGELNFPVEMHESARDSLMSGQWDFLNLLLANEEQIKQTGNKLPYLQKFQA